MPRNLLLRFASDEIDETPQLASTLQSSGEFGCRFTASCFVS